MSGRLAHALLGSALLLGLVGACSSSSGRGPGEWGVLRYFGEIEGTVPLRLLPPITDREGNAYVLYGNRARAEVAAYVGHAAGGWTAGCELHKGDSRGVHGWAGHDDSRAWYWSGDGLVEVSGRTGACHFVLETDPTSSANIRFLGVFPVVTDSPSATELPVLFKTPSDSGAFLATVDLDLGLYKNLKEFEPPEATDISVIGVGAHPTSDEIYLIVSYSLGAEQRLEARFLDRSGTLSGVHELEGLATPDQDAIVGYLHSAGGVVAGLLETGELVTYTRDWARVEPVSGFTPMGVHRWDGTLWLVGVSGSSEPVVTEIRSDGTLGPLTRWETSVAAAENLQPGTDVLDDRSNPTQTRFWETAATAIGPFPFLSEHSPDVYEDDTTGWLVAGPFYDTGVEGMTAVAFGPVGVSYP